MPSKRPSFKQKPVALLVMIACCSVQIEAAETPAPELLLNNAKARDALKNIIRKYQESDKQSEISQLPERKATNDLISDSEVNAETDTSQKVDAPLPNNDVAFDDKQAAETLIDDSRFVVGEELLLGVEIGGQNLTDLFGFKTEQGAQVALLALSQMLELPLEANSNLTSVKGWLYSESNKFTLTVSGNQMSVQHNGQSETLASSQFSLQEDDIYVDLSSVCSWFNLKCEIDESRLKLVLTSSRKTPVELRIARRSNEIKQKNKPLVSVMPKRDSGYKVFSSPVVDAQASTRFTGDGVGGSYSLLGSSDLAYFTGKYFLSGSDQDALSEARLTLNKQSPEGKLFGPLAITEVELGDVLSRGGIGSSTTSGVGVLATNDEISGSFDQQKVNIVGDVQTGWDVELYKNGTLIAQQLAITTGRYEFLDLDLDYGDNDFELVFYGPQGQIETKNESYKVDANSLKKGEAKYRFSAMERGKSLFGVNDKLNSDDSERGFETAITSALGLTDWFTVGTSAAKFKPLVGEEEKSYGVTTSLGLFNLASLVSTYSITKDIDSLSSHNLRTKTGDIAWQLRNTKSEVENDNEQGRDFDEYSVNMSGRMDLFLSDPISYSNSWIRRSDIQTENQTIQNSLSFNTDSGSFSNTLTYVNGTTYESIFTPTELRFLDTANNTVGAGSDGNSDTRVVIDRSKAMSGGLQYRRNFDRIFARAFLGYEIKPEKELSSVGLGVTYPFSPNLNSTFNALYLTQLDQSVFNLSINWQREAVNLSSNFNYNSSGDWSAGLTARWAFGYIPETSSYFLKAGSAAQSGTVTAKVFEDKNLNGSWDQGEPLIKNAKVKTLQGGAREDSTDEDGVAVLTKLTNHVTTDLVVERTSFEDPSMISLIPGVAITPRSGSMDHIEFPVSSSGELEGTLYVRGENGESEPLGFAGIQLLDEQGQVRATTQSEFDGYYLFVDILPGPYRVMIDKKYLKRKGLRESTATYHAVRGQDVVSGKDFMLEMRAMRQGYSADIADFASLTALKAYWVLVSSSGMNVAKLRPFFTQSEDTGRYTLKAGFFKDSADAEKLCNRLMARKLQCKVNQFSFDL